MRQYSISPLEMFASFWRNRSLTFTLAKREVIGRYRGSMMGMAWSFFNPLIMLVIYTLVFSIVFNARWGNGGQESKIDFGIILFVGMTIHGLFAECINRAPNLILSNVNYVKKVIFPLEILPWVAFSSALFHYAISLLALLAAELFFMGHIPITALLIPVVLLPLVLASIGVAWFLSSLGVFIRDIGQITGIITTVLLFISGVFFQISALPEPYRSWLAFNPLALIIEEGRNVLILGKLPDPTLWCLTLALGTCIAWTGFAWFQKTRERIGRCPLTISPLRSITCPRRIRFIASQTTVSSNRFIHACRDLWGSTQSNIIGSSGPSRTYPLKLRKVRRLVLLVVTAAVNPLFCNCSVAHSIRQAAIY